MKRDDVNFTARGFVGERIISRTNSVYEVLNTGQNVRSVGEFREPEDANLDAYAPELFKLTLLDAAWAETADQPLVKLLVQMLDAGLPDSCTRGLEAPIDLLRSRLRS